MNKRYEALQKQCRKYIRRVLRDLPVSRKRKKLIKNKLNYTIKELYVRNIDLTMEDIYAELGTHDEVVNSFIEELDPDDVIKRYRFKRCLAAIVIVVTAFFISYTAVTTLMIQQGMVNSFEIEQYFNGGDR